MAKKTLAQIQAQIDKLNREAEAIRAKEVAGVVQRIKVAIAEYGLTAEDLGLVASRGPVRKARGAMPKAVAESPAVKGAKSMAKSVKPTAAKTAAKAVKSASGKATSKVHGVIKYADGQGHTWTGVGKRPGWFLAALDAGRTAEELLVTVAGT
jgi:DNA-binding protein H-NS